MTSRLSAVVLAVLAFAAVACTACAASPAADSRPRQSAGASCPAAVALPVSPAGLRAAAGLAARFAAAYLTRPPGQSPARWLARLAPMVTSQLRGTLAAIAATPALWPPGQSGTARTVTVRVRDLAPGSVVLTVQARQTDVAASGRAATTVPGLAVTVVQGQAGWVVYDVEPATAGNAG